MSKTRIKDLAMIPCQVPECEGEGRLPFPYCREHNRMVPDDIMDKSKKELAKAAVTGLYNPWRKTVCEGIDAIKAKETRG